LKNLSSTDTPPSREQPEKLYLPDIDSDLVCETETLVATALLMGMDHASRKLDAADMIIPSLSFEDAVSFMKSRVPVTKAEWNDLEPKLHFRAFTVARLAQCDYIDTARQVLYKSLETGKGVAETYKQWQTLQTLVEDDAMKLRPGYWENVFRTNTQTAYTAGKLMPFRNNPPPAWRLLVIDDSRTSDICRGLIRGGKQDITLSSDHPFWGTFGFPPYHYQCRTGLQAVYKSEIDDGAVVENPPMDDLRTRFKPMEGFGGNPLDLESWWMMTENMALRAAHYGIFNEIESFARENGLYNFAMNLVRGKDAAQLIGTNYSARKAALATPLPKELHAARILEENGYTVFFTPENKTKKMKNYDAIIDGRLGDFKRLESFTKIRKRLNEADKQRASVVCLELPIKNHALDEAIAEVTNWFKTSQRMINYVDTVLLIWDENVIPIENGPLLTMAADLKPTGVPPLRGYLTYMP
jgi:hypothetical protein